jgi:pimeloyl-ACP methyl ester carboxylesterase
MTDLELPASPQPLMTPDGRRLDVWLAGPAEATPLVFHAGTPGAGLPFAPFVGELAARGLRYVGFSRAGYGSSTRRPGRAVADVVEDTRLVLDSIGAGSAWVAGWSGGGPHALACAALMADRVLGTALIASVAPYPAEGLDFMAGMGAENIEEFQAAIDGSEALIAFKERNWPIFRAVTAAEIGDALGDLVDDVDYGSIRDEFADWLASLFREGLRESYWGWYDDDMAFVRPWGFELGSITGPVHIWQGAHDRMVPFAHGEWLADHVGGSCVHLHPEHGHLSLAVDSTGAILDELVGTGR